MKKIIGFCVVTLLLVSVIPASAQLRFGVKGGLNVTSVKFNEDALSSDNVTGFQVGPSIEAMVPYVGLGFDISILYARKGSKVTTKAGEKSLNSNYVDVPINLKWKMGAGPAKVFFAAGPYFSFRAGGDNVWNVASDVSDQLKAKRFGTGLDLGAGVELLKHLQVGLTYTIGLTDNYKVNKPTTSNTSYSDLASKPHGWSLAATYYF